MDIPISMLEFFYVRHYTYLHLLRVSAMDTYWTHLDTLPMHVREMCKPFILVVLKI